MPLMTYEEYGEVRHSRPYVFSLTQGSNILYYFGERHSFDPLDEQWTQMKESWREFLTKTEGQKRIVFVEGGRRPLETTEEQAILKHGGMGLATYLAHQEHIETHSPEPDEKYERGELEKRFSREEIQYYYFARVVHQWGRKQDPKPDFEGYIERYLEADKRESGWDDFDFSLDAMKKIHTDLFQTEFNENDTNFFSTVVNPIDLKTKINEVSRASSEIRDTFIVQEIQRYMQEGYSIFVQYGCTHAVMQKPLLREVLA